MKVGAIWAQTPAGVIGRGGAMPWHLPADLRHFAQITAGQAVIMGRRTWASLSPRFRPLPGRRNLVLTRDPAWSAPGAEPVATVADAVARLTGPASLPLPPTLTADAVARLVGQDLWVIGGRQVFDLWAGLITAAEVTVIDLDTPGDTYAPTLDPAIWQVTARDPGEGWHEDPPGPRYQFLSLRRREQP